jgi:hypothetical protein
VSKRTRHGRCALEQLDRSTRDNVEVGVEAPHHIVEVANQEAAVDDPDRLSMDAGGADIRATM